MDKGFEIYFSASDSCKNVLTFAIVQVKYIKLYIIIIICLVFPTGYSAPQGKSDKNVWREAKGISLSFAWLNVAKRKPTEFSYYFLFCLFSTQ